MRLPPVPASTARRRRCRSRCRSPTPRRRRVRVSAARSASSSSKARDRLVGDGHLDAGQRSSSFANVFGGLVAVAPARVPARARRSRPARPGCRRGAATARRSAASARSAASRLVVAGEQALARDHLPQHDAEREDVRSVVDRRARAPAPATGRRACPASRGGLPLGVRAARQRRRLRDAEVEDLHAARLRAT